MNRTILMIAAAICGNVVLAQQAPATIPVAASGSARVSTNGVSPWTELRDIQVKLHPIEEKLIKNDPEIKALLQQRKDAEQFLEDLDKKRRDLMVLKLMADPAAVPLVQRRTELLEKAREMRSAGTQVPPGVMDLSSRTGVPAPSAPAKTP